MRIQHLHVENRINCYLHVVAGNADLFGDVECLLLETVSIGNTLDEGEQNVEAGLQCTTVLAQILDDVRTLLRHDGRGARDYDYRNYGERDEDVGCVHTGGLSDGFT